MNTLPKKFPLFKRSKSNEEYCFNSTDKDSVKVYKIKCKETKEKINCFQEKSNGLLEEDMNNIQRKIQKQIHLLNLEMERQEEQAVLKSQEMQSYRQIVHTPFLLAAHFLYSFFYKPRRRQNFL